MTQKVAGVALVLVCLLAATTERTEATTLIKKNLAALAAEAELIVIGTVVSTEAAFLDGQALIYTHNTILVSDTLKGDALNQVVVSEPGGVVGNVGSFVHMMPQYAAGTRVLVFLKRDALGLWRTHGLVQGQYSVITNRATEEDLVLPQQGLPWVTGPFFQPAQVGPRGVIAVEDFIEKVEELVAKAKADEKEQKTAGNAAGRNGEDGR